MNFLAEGSPSAEAYSPEQLVIGGLVKTLAVTLLAGAALPRLTVLGQITASKKFIQCVDTAVDGSQVAKAILVEDVAVSGADRVVPVYVEGEFAMQGLVWDASFTTDAEKLNAFVIGGGILVKKLGYSGG